MDFDQLSLLFASDPLSAIDECKKMICSLFNFRTYDEFFSHHKKEAHYAICPNYSTNLTQSYVYCADCSKKTGNYTSICFQCFLKGNHEGHNYYIFPTTYNICNCGDHDFFENTSFCSEHKGINADDNNPENYLDETLRETLINIIFSAAFSSFKTYSTTSDTNINKIFDFILSFTFLGDGFRRLLAQSLTRKIDFDDFIFNIPSYSKTFNLLFQKLTFSLITDQEFIREFSKSFYRLFYKKIILQYHIDSKNGNAQNYLMFLDMIPPLFSEPICRYHCENNGWDWVTSAILVLAGCKLIFTYIIDPSYKFYNDYFQPIFFIKNITVNQPDEKVQSFFDRTFTSIFRCAKQGEKDDSIVVTSFKNFLFYQHRFPLHEYYALYRSLCESFKDKPNLRVNKLIEELDKIDINPIFLINKNENASENDVLVSKYLYPNRESNPSFFKKFKSAFKNLFTSYPSKYYRSFYNGAAFYFTYPIFDAFCSLFQLDQFFKIKFARFLCKESYQPLRIKLGIVALEKLLSKCCYEIGITNQKNDLLYKLYDQLSGYKQILCNLIPVPALQLTIGLQCESNNLNDEFMIKEFFAYEIARKVGLFDSKYKTIIGTKMYVFLYVCLLIVNDRVSFNDENNEKYIEEFLINNLKCDPNITLQSLFNLTNSGMPNDFTFTEKFHRILMKIATTKNEINGTENVADNDDEDHMDNDNLIKHSIHRSDDDDDDDENEDQINNNNDENQNQISNNEENQIDNGNENNRNNERDKNFAANATKFYLKKEVKWNPIVFSDSIFIQEKYMNKELSKNPNKLLEIPRGESEETYFFKPNDNDNNNDNNNSLSSSEGLNIRLRKLLLTPTVFAVIYFALIENNEFMIHIVQNLAMNTLVLISETIKEETDQTESATFDEQTSIHCTSVLDLVSQLKRIIYNFKIEGRDDIKDGFIEDRMNSANFVAFLNMKIALNQKEPKSVIELLKEKGPLGNETLQKISQNIQLDGFTGDDEKQEENKKKEAKEKVNKMKEDILKQFQNKRNKYCLSDSLSISNSSPLPFIKEKCCICSESKKEILSYPIYMYRTKLPFIFDKPPLFESTVEGVSVDDNQYDFGRQEDLINWLTNTLQFNQNASDSDLLKRAQVFETIMKKLMKIKAYGDTTKKRLTAGANFVIQFGICQHPIHEKCVTNMDGDTYKCPIDNSNRNYFLPCLEDIPINEIFSDIKQFTLCEDKYNAISAIKAFVEKFESFFEIIDYGSINTFIELVKSLSGMIETFEIRLRNRPDSLDCPKNQILATNLFLLVWYAYRIYKKPDMKIINQKDNTEIDVESRLTSFQRFIKHLVECDDIFTDKSKVKNIISASIDSVTSERNDDLEKETYLLMRRICLTEHFILDEDVTKEEDDIIDWDDILEISNLSKRYNVKFTSIDIENGEYFELMPFTFMELPKEFIKLAGSPYNVPLQFSKQISFINLLDYNYHINHFNNFEEVHSNNENNNNENTSEIERFKKLVISCDETALYILLSIYAKRVYPSTIMYTGLHNPMTIIIDSKYAGSLLPFYVDKFGFPELNYNRNIPLFLNENNYEMFVDKILSGDFSYDLHTLNIIQRLIH
ncbi:hypothetical protein M9Y10_030691 [Tritrichomonas musculus]|uniref:E3 ubiquitin-protein ligase n=1 Tax=Tritrichomonas musculus TaxID=1915356 RepID=A0ABR2H3R9_9EUKA